MTRWTRSYHPRDSGKPCHGKDDTTTMPKTPRWQGQTIWTTLGWSAQPKMSRCLEQGPENTRMVRTNPYEKPWSSPARSNVKIGAPFDISRMTGYDTSSDPESACKVEKNRTRILSLRSHSFRRFQRHHLLLVQSRSKRMSNYHQRKLMRYGN